jgi:hypothetical protein
MTDNERALGRTDDLAMVQDFDVGTIASARRNEIDHPKSLSRYHFPKFPELVFNLDGAGSSDCDDRKSKRTIVPKTVSSDERYRPGFRRYRHIALLADVHAVGDELALMIAWRAPIGELSFRTPVLQRDKSANHVNEQPFSEFVTVRFIPYLTVVGDHSDTHSHFASRVSLAQNAALVSHTLILEYGTEIHDLSPPVL